MKKQKNSLAKKNLSLVPEEDEFKNSFMSEVKPRYSNIVHDLS